MDQKYTNDTFYYYKDLDQNLAWLTQETEGKKSNKENVTFPTYRVNVIKNKVIKKSGIFESMFFIISRINPRDRQTIQF